MPDPKLSDQQINQAELAKLRRRRAIEEQAKNRSIERLRTDSVSAGNYPDKMVHERDIEKG